MLTAALESLAKGHDAVALAALAAELAGNPPADLALASIAFIGVAISAAKCGLEVEQAATLVDDCNDWKSDHCPKPECTQDSDCKVYVLCSPQGTCVRCLTDSDCADDLFASRCNPTTYACVQCLADADCADDFASTTCDTMTNSCE